MAQSFKIHLLFGNFYSIITRRALSQTRLFLDNMTFWDITCVQNIWQFHYYGVLIRSNMVLLSLVTEDKLWRYLCVRSRYVYKYYTTTVCPQQQPTITNFMQSDTIPQYISCYYCLPCTHLSLCTETVYYTGSFENHAPPQSVISLHVPFCARLIYYKSGCMLLLIYSGFHKMRHAQIVTLKRTLTLFEDSSSPWWDHTYSETHFFLSMWSYDNHA